MASNYDIRIDHAVLTFRNFSGTKGEYNPNGDRLFSVFLDGYNRRGEAFQDPDKVPQYRYGGEWLSPNDLIEALERDKWHVSWAKEKVLETGEVYHSRPKLKVKVKLNPDRPQFNPKIYTVNKDGEATKIGEESFHLLDGMWISNADLIIKPFYYEESKGIADGHVAAQLKILYVTPVADVDEDEFDGKYSVRVDSDDDIPW